MLPRPNPPGRRVERHRSDSFNGGSGVTPTECHSADRCRVLSSASMEGRVLPRPNCAVTGHPAPNPQASMEGRVLPRPNGLTPRPDRWGCWLQWRVGCYPDRMATAAFVGGCELYASMEGRVLPRPNLTADSATPREVLASMEGRVLPRPNGGACPPHTPPEICFNGGSGVTPTEWSFHPSIISWLYPLQWRVGCYPDRILSVSVNPVQGGQLQWRVGCYPDRIRGLRAQRQRQRGFNGGSGVTPTESVPHGPGTRHRTRFNGGSGVTPTE